MKEEMTEEKTCHDCWQYDRYCDKCEKGWCYWFTRSKSPGVGSECEAYNSRMGQRNHRDENAELMPKLVEFFEFLQKNSLPDGFVINRHLPKLTMKQAFTVIYIMQEFLYILPDCFDQCQECLQLYDADREGYYLDDQCELDGKTLPKKYWGHYCDSCVPCVDFTLG